MGPPLFIGVGHLCFILNIDWILCAVLVADLLPARSAKTDPQPLLPPDTYGTPLWRHHSH